MYKAFKQKYNVGTAIRSMTLGGKIGGYLIFKTLMKGKRKELVSGRDDRDLKNTWTPSVGKRLEGSL